MTEIFNIAHPNMYAPTKALFNLSPTRNVPLVHLICNALPVRIQQTSCQTKHTFRCYPKGICYLVIVDDFGRNCSLSRVHIA